MQHYWLWPPCVADMDIIFSCCGFFFIFFFFFFLLFFLAYSQQSQSGCLPYFYTWCGLSANLEYRYEMCYTWLAENTGCKKSPSQHHHTTLSGYIFATKAHIDNRKKLVKQQYLLHMSSQYGELQPTNGWDLLASLEHPCKFQLVSRLGSITVQHYCSGRQPNFAALNSGRHLYSAGRPSRWALAHILVLGIM